MRSTYDQRNRSLITSDDKPSAIAERVPVLSSIDERIASADDPHEIVMLTQVRNEIARQDEESRDREHSRWVDRTKIWLKVGGSFVGIAVGSGLLIGGFSYPGFFVLGAGIFGLFPGYVKAFLKSNRRTDRGFPGDD